MAHEPTSHQLILTIYHDPLGVPDGVCWQPATWVDAIGGYQPTSLVVQDFDSLEAAIKPAILDVVEHFRERTLFG